jgi:hypothetical protein
MSTTMGLYIVKGQCEVPLSQPAANCPQEHTRPSILRPENGSRLQVVNDRSTLTFDERICLTEPHILVPEAPYVPSQEANDLEILMTGHVSPPVNYQIWERKLEIISKAFLDRQIKAISFVPKNPQKTQTLFIERLQRVEDSESFIPSNFEGYIQPYINRFAVHNPRDAHPHSDYPIDFLRNPDEIETSVRDCLNSEENRISAKPILASFLSDPQTQMVALTFVDRVTHIWAKLDL